MKKKNSKKYRSAKTGRYVSASYARKHPKTTVGETTKTKCKRKRAVMNAFKDPKSEAAFQKYCLDPVVQHALSESKGTLNENLLRDCFMAGASYGVARRKAESQ